MASSKVGVLPGVDLGDTQQDDGTELAGHRIAHFVQLELEGGVGHGRIGKLRARDRAEIDVGLAQALLLCDRGEVGAGLDASREAAFAAAMSGKAICCTCRFSGVPSWSLLAS